LAALGPEPEDNKDESEDITERRAALKLQIKTEEAPSREAAEAFERASGLIAEVDEIIRSRQTAQLFELQKSPLNPSLLIRSFNGLGLFIQSIRDEAVDSHRLDQAKFFRDFNVACHCSVVNLARYV
jgi:hypothetical protein